ncbi:hypothetical protein [Pendulispora albinea]|uniref:Lipoprotein n=1 Tax=Pendulispora albinea TaxID=2741071 RepID=A0ABZ2LSD8_9BACT
MLFARLTRFAFATSLMAATALGIAACRVSQPQGRAEGACVDQCKTKAQSRCNEEACIRGCRFILDRLMEHEGSGIISCVAKGPHKECDDRAWATCAASVGIHADGGPPAPASAEEE